MSLLDRPRGPDGEGEDGDEDEEADDADHLQDQPDQGQDLVVQESGQEDQKAAMYLFWMFGYTGMLKS